MFYGTGEPTLRRVHAKRREFLAQRRSQELLAQPRLAELEHLLLACGGAAVVFRSEPDLELILGRGRKFALPFGLGHRQLSHSSRTLFFVTLRAGGLRRQSMARRGWSVAAYIDLYMRRLG